MIEDPGRLDIPLEHVVRDWLEGGGGALGAAARVALTPAAWCYGAAQTLRRRAFESGCLRSVDAGVPVVSIGNLTAGGAGKTPAAAWLLRRLLAAGRRPGVLLRGYRAGTAKTLPKGRAPASQDDAARDPARGSDEAQWYLESIPGVLVEVDADRVAGARRAVEAGADMLVLDDGFQHARLRRDFDLVLVDAAAPAPARAFGRWGAGRCFPAGLMREPWSALARADAVVLTRTDQAGVARALRWEALLRERFPALPLYRARHEPGRLADLSGRPVAGGLSALAGRRVAAAAGIGRPEAFAATLTSLGADVKRLTRFPDHHGYRPGDIDLMRLAAAVNAAHWVTTEKDAVKLRALIPADSPERAGIWVLGVDMKIDGDDALTAAIQACARPSGHLAKRHSGTA